MYIFTNYKLSVFIPILNNKYSCLAKLLPIRAVLILVNAVLWQGQRAFALSVSSRPIVYALLFDQIALWVAVVDADIAVDVAKTSDISTETLAVGDTLEVEEDIYNDDFPSKNQQDRVDEYFGEKHYLKILSS